MLTKPVYLYSKLSAFRSEAYIGPMSMRIVGNRTTPKVGLRGPTEDEIRASVESSQRSPRQVPRGVYRYRNHAEANAAMDQWIVDGMVEKARALGFKAS